MSILMRGMLGEPVRVLQEKLGVNADGVFGAGTETALKDYQTQNGLRVDGIAGPDTFSSMGLHELVLLTVGTKGDTVKKLQEALGVDADGIYGKGTAAAVKKFQEEQGLDADGIAGPATLAKLPAFQDVITEAQVNASVITETTPVIEGAAVDAALAEAPKEEHQGLIGKIQDALPTSLQQAEDRVAAVGKSIWNTVKSIF